MTTTTDLERLSPAVLPLLPLVYVAWADGELTAEEMEHLCAEVHRMAELDELDGASREALDRWLDPTQPPTARELQRMLSFIREAAREMGEEARTSLADLGIELARVRSAEPTQAASSETRAALEAVQESLGVVPAEASREILVAERPTPAEVEEEAPELPVESLSRFLDGRYGEIRRRLRERLAGKEFHRPLELGREEYRRQVLLWLERLAADGYGALSYPLEEGGDDDLGAFMAAFETLATHDLSLTVKFGVQFGLWGGSILFLGDDEQRRRYLRDTGEARLLGCFAMSETGHGSNVQELETVARFDGGRDAFVLTTPRPEARKDYIGNAARDGRIATVFAQLEVGGERHGVHAFVVPIRDDEGRPLPGVAIEDCGPKLGLNGVDNGRLSLAEVEVPRENLLGRFARVGADGEYTSPIASPNRRFFTMLGTLVGGRISVAAAAVSAAKSGLSIAVRYGLRRRQFGPAGECETRLLDYPTHRRRLMPLLAHTFAFDFAVKSVRDRFLERTEEDQIEVEHLAAGVKALATWQTTATLQECRECCGGVGYLAENRFAELKADTDVFTTFEGDNTVLLLLVARGLLTGFRQQFAEARLKGLVRYVAESARITVAEKNPVVTRKTDPEHLRDPEVHAAAFDYRRRRLLATAAQRMQSRLESGMDSYDAFLECQTHLLALARAHVEGVVAEAFRDAVARCDDELRPVLELLRDLSALSQLEHDRAWFLEQGYFEGTKAKAIRDLVDELCGQVRRHALGLVEAFSIPEALLQAPIASADGDPAARAPGSR